MTYAALPILRTPRLTLRPLRETDADAIVNGVGNYDVSRWLGRVPYPYDRSDALSFIEKVIDGAHRIWAVENEADFIGVAGVQEELGYWLARSAWRKGFGFEAAHAVVGHWFSDPNAASIESGYYNENARSAEVLRALGFRKTGESLRYAKSLSQQVMGSDLVLDREAWAARQSITITTPRLVLREWTVADAPALSRLVTENVARMTGSMSAGWTVEEAANYIAARLWKGVPGFLLAIEKDGELVGAIGCGSAPVSLMYILGEKYWGQGFATEAVNAFLPEVFDRFPVMCIVADCFEDNPTSAKVLLKAGFDPNGTRLGNSKARLEPAPVITYALKRDKFRVPQ